MFSLIQGWWGHIKSALGIFTATNKKEWAFDHADSIVILVITVAFAILILLTAGREWGAYVVPKYYGRGGEYWPEH